MPSVSYHEANALTTYSTLRHRKGQRIYRSGWEAALQLRVLPFCFCYGRNVFCYALCRLESAPNYAQVRVASTWYFVMFGLISCVKLGAREGMYADVSSRACAILSFFEAFHMQLNADSLK